MDKGLGLLEWTGKVVPQGLLVSGEANYGWLPDLRLRSPIDDRSGRSQGRVEAGLADDGTGVGPSGPHRVLRTSKLQVPGQPWGHQGRSSDWDISILIICRQ